MATVTGLTAARMIAIEASSVVDGDIVGNNLILTKFSGATIDAGNVRGPTGAPGVSNAELTSFIQLHVPIGSIQDYIGVAAPTNWLTMAGQTIVNGQTLYPALWAVLPAAMKSGSSILMPNTKGRVTVGYDSADADFDAIGKAAGAKTHILSQAQLPMATITIDPPSTVISIDPPSTLVTVDPPNTNTSPESAAHDHTISLGTSPVGDHNHAQYVSSSVAGGPAIRTDMDLDTPGGAAYYDQGITTGNGGAHAHTVNGNTSPENQAHVHALDISPFNISVDIAPFNATVDVAPFNSGALGSGQAHNNLQPYIAFLKIIKAL